MYKRQGHKHYTIIEPAYRTRFGQWADQIKMDATLGITLHERFMMMPQLNYTQAVGDNTLAVNSSGVISDYDLLKATVSIIYRYNHDTRLQAGGFAHLQERNTGRGGGLLFSVWREF